MRISYPLTQQELKQGDLIPKGIYNFEVINAEDTVSKSSGIDMIKLTIKIWLENGKERIIYDNLMESMKFKLGHFAEVTGLIDQYNANLLTPESCIGKTGSLKIIIQTDKNGVYPDKNSVVDYVPQIKSSMLNPLGIQGEKKEFINDDLPF